MKKTALVTSAIVGSLLATALTTSADQTYLRNDVYSSMSAPNGGPWGGWTEKVFCPPGTYVSGFNMKVEPPQGGGDDTALNSVALFCSDRAGNRVSQIVPHPGQWGGWMGEANCPRGQFAWGLALKVEGKQGGGDDTAANSVSLVCDDMTRIEAPGGGGWGSWGQTEYCAQGSRVCGVRAKIEPSQGGGDDTALNNLELTCCTF